MQDATTAATSETARGAAVGRGSLLLLAIAYVGFVSLGLPDPVAGVAWPSVRETFGLEQAQFGWVFIALGCGYCTSGFFGGRLTHALGLGRLLWVSSALVAGAMIGSGLAGGWWVIVVSGAVWGLGSGGIDAGLNAYASRHFSARHMNWLHACYSIGATIGPWLMTLAIVTAGSWRAGYGIVGGLLAAMAGVFLVTRERWNDGASDANGARDGSAGSSAAVADATEAKNVTTAVAAGVVLREPLVWLQCLLFFLYVGLEFSVGQWCFTLLTESREVPRDWAGTITGGYYAAIGVGRVLAGAVAHRLGLDRLIRIAMGTAIVGAALYAWGEPSGVGVVGVIIVGLGLAPIFPSLMTRTGERLGPAHAMHAVGFQVSAGMLGAAVMPSVAGVIAEAWGLESVALFAVVQAVMLMLTHELLLRAPAGT
jgi:fucose permease